MRSRDFFGTGGGESAEEIKDRMVAIWGTGRDVVDVEKGDVQVGADGVWWVGGCAHVQDMGDFF